MPMAIATGIGRCERHTTPAAVASRRSDHTQITQVKPWSGRFFCAISRYLAASRGIPRYPAISRRGYREKNRADQGCAVWLNIRDSVCPGSHTPLLFSCRVLSASDRFQYISATADKHLQTPYTSAGATAGALASRAFTYRYGTGKELPSCAGEGV